MEFGFPWPMSQGEWLAWIRRPSRCCSASSCSSPRESPFACSGCSRAPTIRRRSRKGAPPWLASILGVGLCCDPAGPAAALHGARRLLAVRRLRPSPGDDVGWRQYALQLGGDRRRTGAGGAAAGLCFRLLAVNRRITARGMMRGCDNSAINACQRTCCGPQKPVLDGIRLSAGGMRLTRTPGSKKRSKVKDLAGV